MTNLHKLDLAYTNAVKAVRSRLQTFTEQVFTSGQWRDADADRFVAAVAPVVAAGQVQVASMTNAWLARRLSQQLGRTVSPRVDRSQVTGTAVRKVDPGVMYRRPYVKVHTDLADGKTLTESVGAGLALARLLVATNLQLTKTATVQQILTGTDGVVGYRRVLTGAKSCALCYVASTQRYTRSDLMPIHPGCDCSVAPITGTGDPGHIIAPDVLEGTHEAMSERFGGWSADARNPRDYRKALLVQDNSEIGPVLTVESHRFASL